MVKKTLKERDDELRRASCFPAGTFGAPNLLHMEDEERTRAAMGLFPHLGIGHVGSSATTFRRTAQDRIKGKPVTEQMFPPPVENRPMPGASVEAIKAWNAFVEAIPDQIRFKYLGLPAHWFDRFGKIHA